MPLEVLVEILSVMRRNKLRTMLTALSVAWGTFMLAILLGAGRGLQNGVSWEFRDDAVAAIWIRTGKTSLSFAGRGPGREIKLTNDDYQVLSQTPGVGEISGRYYLRGDYPVSHGDKHGAFDIRGTHPGHRYLEKTEIVRGRFLNDRDVAERRKVTVIGSEVRRALFGEDNPLGQRVDIGSLAYLVVGEFEDVGGEGELRKLYVPISTAQLVQHAQRRIHHLMFTLTSDDLENSKRVEKRAQATLARRHQVSPGDRRAIRMQNNLEQFRKVTEVFTWLDAFVWIVGIGTLVAGVVGVSNIMLISVAERKKEIGIRKALGATPSSIVRMIVSEAVLITTFAGCGGLAAGMGLVELVNRKLGEVPFLRHPEVDLDRALLATGALILAGTLAGLFPALRAAKVDPIVALREGP